MEDIYGCNLINTRRDGRQVTEFVGRYHVHVLVRQGQMTFSDGRNFFTASQGDLAIWQMSRLARALIAAQQPFSFSFLLFSFYFSFCATFPFLFLFVFFSFVFVTCIANDANALNALQNVADDANEKTTTRKVKI